MRKAGSGLFRSVVSGAMEIWGWGSVGGIPAMPQSLGEGCAFSADVGINLLRL